MSRKKFNPPLKRQDIKDLSVNDCCSASLPASQTHTLLSLCDQQNILQNSQTTGILSHNTTSTCNTPLVENSPQHQNPTPTMQSSNRFSIHKQKESYKYCMYPFPRPKTKMATGRRTTIRPKPPRQQQSVYDYALTPSTTYNKANRTKEQAR